MKCREAMQTIAQDWGMWHGESQACGMLTIDTPVDQAHNDINFPINLPNNAKPTKSIILNTVKQPPMDPKWPIAVMLSPKRDRISP